MKKMRIFLLLALALGVFAYTSKMLASPASEPISSVVSISEVEWSPLNPARGDNSPKAGTLWGDRTGFGASGFLVEFVDDFSSPPHIHNITYRGVVISGLIHNDDPNAKKMWLSRSSFWTQPAGEVHITAAKDSKNLAYIEIERGPYLVLPPEEAFDSGEKPVNLDASNIVWIDPPGRTASADGAKIAFIWGNPQGESLNGSFIKLPTGFTGMVRSHGSTLRAVIIQGRLMLRQPGENILNSLEPGSYFSSLGKSVHLVSCEAEEECVIYMRVKGTYDVIRRKQNLSS